MVPDRRNWRCPLSRPSPGMSMTDLDRYTTLEKPDHDLPSHDNDE